MQGNKKNILFLTSHLPIPAISGGRLREYEVLKGITNEYNVYLVVITKTYDIDMRNVSKLGGMCTHVSIFKSYEEKDDILMSRHFPSKVLRVISSRATKYIDSLLTKGIIDLIHLESFYMVYYILKGVSVPTVLVAQNIEFDLLWQEIKLNERAPEVQVLIYDYQQTKFYEQLSWNICDKFITLTKEDYKKAIECVEPNKVELIPNGFDHIIHMEPTHENSDMTLADNSILITGNFLYKPNEDAVIHFCTQIFPKIIERVSNAMVYVVGNEPTQKMYNLDSTYIKIVGNVPNLYGYIKNTSIFVCPLRIGGGVKVKMLEAISCNAVIVTSSIGAQGLSELFPRPFVVADDVDDFAEKVVFLLTHPGERDKIKARTYNAITQLNTWAESTHRISGIYKGLLMDYRLS